MTSAARIITRIAEVTSELRHTQALHLAGCTPRELGARVRAEELVRLRRGWYLPAAYWAGLHAEDRQLALIRIAHLEARSRPVFSHYSAAALHGLPLDDRIPSRAHTITSPIGFGGAEQSVVRHRLPVDPSDVVEVGPYLCTSPERTVLDLACAAPAPLALGCADALLRESCRVDRFIDWAAVEDWRRRMLDRAEHLAGNRGVRTARWISAFADPRADSPLESVSRYHLQQLGFEFKIQVPVPAPGGGSYYLDFELTGLRLFGECDGKVKYTDARMLGGNTPAEQVYAEKRRTDWIEGREQKRVIRWGAPDVRSTSHFAARLHALGVPLPRRAGLILARR